MTLRLLDLFSGIGGFSYAAERLVGGFSTTAFVEREPFCQSILRKHWPEVPIHDDITTFAPAFGSADVVCGGFPCQDISQAGKGAGIKEGTRSGLFYEMVRVIRLVRPRFVVMENVAAITSNGLGVVLGEMAKIGYDCEWCCIRAADVGACHMRDRWWCIAKAAADAEGKQCDDVRGARAGEQAEPKSGNGNGPAAADTYDTRSQGRQPALLRQYPGERPAWPSHPSGGVLSPDWRSYVSEPVLCRGDDGLSGRVDRLKALGNAVVPQVVAIPLARVKQLAERQ